MAIQQKMLRCLRPVWAWPRHGHICRGLIQKAALFTVLLFSPEIAAAQGTTQSLVYEVYAGGIHAVQAKVKIDVQPEHYEMTLEARTRGFLGKILPWAGKFETEGWAFPDGRRQPQQHKSTAVWKNETDVSEYLFEKDGTFKSLTVTDYEKDPYEKDVKSDVSTGAIDVLTAALLVFEQYNQTGKCAGSSEVFDGKRRFRQVFTHEKNVELQTSSYNIYGGPAAQCTVEVVPVSGKWHKKPRGWLYIQEQGRNLGMMPTLWLAQIDENGPAVPVKIHIKTIYGSMFMHLAEYKSGDEVLVAQKRVLDEKK